MTDITGPRKRARGKSCPICRKPVDADYKPFCSARCEKVDLGRWLGEAYVLPGSEPSGGDIEDRE